MVFRGCRFHRHPRDACPPLPWVCQGSAPARPGRSCRRRVWPAPNYRLWCPDKSGQSAPPALPGGLWRRTLAGAPGKLLGQTSAAEPDSPTLPPVLPTGTRIIYDRKFLLDRRNSPMAKTPPCHLPNIPGVTSPGEAGEEPKADANSLNHQEGKPSMGKGPPGRAGGVWGGG